MARVQGGYLPLSAERAQATGGAASILHYVPLVTLQVLLGVGDEAETVVEALSVGQVCCRLPACIL